MEISSNFTEQLPVEERSEPTQTSATVAAETEVAGEHRASELGMWLRALRGFFQTQNHPLSETERAELSSRDFSSETRIAQVVLMRCSQLLLGLIHSAAPTHPAQTTETEMLGGASFSEREEAAAPDEATRSLQALSDALRDAWAIGDALLAAQQVSLSQWASLGSVLARELESISSARRLMRRSTHVDLPRAQPLLPPLTERLTPDALGANVFAVFSQLSLLLERLRFVEALLRRDQPLKQTLPIFTLVREETHELLELIETRILRMENLDSAVQDVLDATAYAIRMELRKAFEHELTGLTTLRQAPALYAKVEAAHGLLRDCFQQSTVALAQIFDPTLDGARLFNSFQTKLEQSLALRRDLWMLLQLVRRAEQERERRPLAPLLEQLTTFRDGSMRFLMYKDWESFDRFVEEIVAARGAVELGPVLHRFSAYLETLFGQINMRAVLSAHAFDYPNIED